jgi:hypothetical protein
MRLRTAPPSNGPRPGSSTRTCRSSCAQSGTHQQIRITRGASPETAKQHMRSPTTGTFPQQHNRLHPPYASPYQMAHAFARLEGGRGLPLVACRVGIGSRAPLPSRSRLDDWLRPRNTRQRCSRARARFTRAALATCCSRPCRRPRSARGLRNGATVSGTRSTS